MTDCSATVANFLKGKKNKTIHLHKKYTGVDIGFSETDYVGLESRQTATVVVTKRGQHSNPLEVTITPVTYQQFQDLGMTLNSDIALQTMPDPAESKQCFWFHSIGDLN